MKYTTLCYLMNDDQVLMLYRNKKKNDPNAGKWIGVGGKLEAHELPVEAALREFKEETGLVLEDIQSRGLLLFVSDRWEEETIYLFSATQYSGEIIDCNEGDLKWVQRDEVLSYPMWEGDRNFLELLLNDHSYFECKLEYQGETCGNVTLFD